MCSPEQMSEDEFHQMFYDDYFSDGELSWAEFKRINIKLGEPLSDEENEKIIKDLDTNSYNGVTYVAFMRWWRRSCHNKQSINNDDQTTKNQQVGSVPTTPSSNDNNQIEEEQIDNTALFIVFIVIGIIVIVAGLFWIKMLRKKRSRGEWKRKSKYFSFFKKITQYVQLTFFSFLFLFLLLFLSFSFSLSLSLFLFPTAAVPIVQINQNHGATQHTEHRAQAILEMAAINHHQQQQQQQQQQFPSGYVVSMLATPTVPKDSIFVIIYNWNVDQDPSMLIDAFADITNNPESFVVHSEFDVRSLISIQKSRKQLIFAVQDLKQKQVNGDLRSQMSWSAPIAHAYGLALHSVMNFEAKFTSSSTVPFVEGTSAGNNNYVSLQADEVRLPLKIEKN